MIIAETEPLIKNNIYNFDICIVICSILSISSLFLDILFGFINIIHCNTFEKPLINIFIWMRVNGIISLFTLVMLIIIRNEVFIYYGISYKLVRIISIVLNLFLVVWSGIGMVSFFMHYDINDNYYIMIRMGIAPVISILKLLEMYYS